LKELLAGGDMSTLGPTVDECEFYKDRGEEGTESRVYAFPEEYRLEGREEEYNYLMKLDGKWYVDGDLLSDRLEKMNEI
jgi:hypothetical protein